MKALLAPDPGELPDVDHVQVKPVVCISANKGPSPSWPLPQTKAAELPCVEPFAAELLPEALRAYILDVADRQQAPPDFAAVTALCGLAAVLGNKVRIRPKQHDDWEVVPTQWGAIIGRPSAMKSPSLMSALRPLYALQDELRGKWEAECVEAAVDDQLASLNAKTAQKKAEKLLKNGDAVAARLALADIARQGGDEPPRPRIVVNDASVEKLGELLNENENGLLLVRDELTGFLARIESEEFQSERAFYLETFNGDGQFTYDRIGRGTVHIKNCTLSMIGGIQPSRLAPIVRNAVSGAKNDGLIQRLQLAVWPDDIGSWQWVDRAPDAAAYERYERAYRDLHELQLGPHLKDEKGHFVLRFSAAAQVLFQEWMTDLQTEARRGGLPSALESHILKMPKTIAGLALLFELVDGGREEVGEIATRRALGWAEYLRSHATRIYAAGETMAENGAMLIVARRKQLPPQFTARDIQRKGWAGLGDHAAVSAALDLLVERHFCRPLPSEPQPAGGRPSLTYVWNPHLDAEG